MEKNKWMNYVWKILWVIGLCVSATVSFNIDQKLQSIAQQTLDPFLILWTRPLISLMFGFYISLLIIKKWTLNVNRSLLWCVAIPCVLLAFIYPLAVTIEQNNPGSFINSLMRLWIYKISTSNAFGIAAGISLVLSLFAPKRAASEEENRFLGAGK